MAPAAPLGLIVRAIAAPAHAAGAASISALAEPPAVVLRCPLITRRARGRQMAGMNMTEDERERFNAMERQIAEVHAALFKPAFGEKTALVEKLDALVRVSEKGSWAVSWIVKIVLTLGALVAAIAAIKTGFNK